MKTTELENVLHTLMCDAYKIEEAMSETLQEMADAANHADVRTIIHNHVSETKSQLERLDNAFRQLDAKRKDVESPITDALIEQGNILYKGCEEGPVRDAALLIALQRIQHQEIATYGSIRALAKALNKPELESLAGSTLDEEYASDKRMSEIAEGFINVTAAYEKLAA
ncbi:MAG: DUF892 family protein [Alphaproteobacteria bacterium]|nr:DUF892 family protein [Alphaproteobacteria bacterium]